MAKGSRIIKVAGLSLAGFCAVSLVADKALGPEAAQIAGYCGAFVGALVGRGRARPHLEVAEQHPSAVAQEKEQETSLTRDK